MYEANSIKQAHMAFHWILERVKFTGEIEISSGDRVYTIGRSKENVINCPSLHVSRKHCKILQRGENLTVVDLSSSNGTYINKNRILSEREIPLQEGDLIGVGVTETTASDCYVFRLCRKFFKKLVPQLHTLSDSSTCGHEVFIVSDSDSESGVQDSRKAEAEKSRKQPAKEECVLSPKVPRPGNATMSSEIPSNLSVIISDVSSGSVKGERKRQYEDCNDVTGIKNHAYGQKSRRLERRFAMGTACASKAFDMVSFCDEIEEKNVNTSSESVTVLDKDHSSGLTSDHVTCAASNSDSAAVGSVVENELQSKVKPVTLLSEVRNRCKRSPESCASVHLNSATSNKRKSDIEQVSAVTDPKRITESAQVINPEPEGLHHCRTNSITMDMTVVSEPVGSEEMGFGLQNGISSTESFKNELLNSGFRCVTKKEVVCNSDSLQRISAVSSCNLNTEKHEHHVEQVFHEELHVCDIKTASKPSSIGQSPIVNKPVSPGTRDVNKWLGTDKAQHTGSIGACTSSIADGNKNAVSSDFVEGNALDDDLMDQICKNKLVVKLEKLDIDAWKSDKLIISEPETESLNYTLDEDVIVISGDSDEDFPSSQIFDDQKPFAGLLKTEGQDAAHEEPVFHKIIEDVDEIVLEDDDSDFENWFKKLSQQDLEPEAVSELSDKHLPVEVKRKEPGSREVSVKDISQPQVATDGEGTENVLVVGDLLEMGCEVKQRHKEQVNKHTYNAKTLIIDAPPLPPRRAFQRGISAETATRMYREQMDVCQQAVKAGNIYSNVTNKRETNSRKERVKLHVHSSDIPRNLTAIQKKQIADKRKEKLKAISEKKKTDVVASKKGSLKVRAKVRIKVTNKNRGAFLMEGAEPTDSGAEVSNIVETSVFSSAVKELHLDVNNLPTEGGTKDSAPQPKRRESRSSSAPVRSTKMLPRIPRISERLSSSSCSELEVPSGAKVETTSVDMFPVLTNDFLTFPILKTIISTRNTKEKKKVRFKNDSEMVQVHVIPVAENSRLLPVNHKKDAPTPRKVVGKQLQQKGPDLEEILYHILCWNPKWLMEQKKQAVTHPPPVYGNTLWPMLSSFVTYSDYLRVLTPLLLLEMWTSVTKDHEGGGVHRKAHLVVGIDQVDGFPQLTLNRKQLMHITCHAVLCERASQEHVHPHVGDLVYLELELENSVHHNVLSETSAKQRRVVPIFAYVKNTIKETVSESTKVHKEILKHLSRPSIKLILVLLTKYRPYDVKMSHAMRLMVVSYIKPDLRLFQAMSHLPSSPLCNHILMPTTQDFSLSDITSQDLVPFIKQDKLNEAQKRAILQIADACSKAEPKICMVQGPPGTGKSLVIVNLIIQILYAQKQYRKHGSRRNVPRILVCAPSNAAIDELVIRLLQIRQSIQKEDRFRMVRTGRQETMKPSVRDISVVELAKRDARNFAQVLECVESVDLEICTLEARKNSLALTLETARQKNKKGVISQTEFKLGEVEMKLCQMKKSKMQNTSVQPQDLLRFERDAQSRIILGADIVATTLSSCFNNQMETVFNMHKHKDTAGFHFTCCIVDEATQSQELETLIPLMLGVSTLVLVGDAEQLPATVLSKVAKDHGLGTSLFARLQTCFEDTVRNPVLFLDTQYRMHPDICLWPSRYFYNGRLQSAPNMAHQRCCPLVPFCILSLDYTQNISGELSNVGEAELVCKLTLGLLEKFGNQQYSIAIITPYNIQRNVITSLLHARSHASQNVEVNTIDSFQGQERDIIVMSCVRTGGIGFLSDRQRLNVALTRARCSLLLCGNFTSLQNDSTWHALLENAEKRNVLKYVPSNVTENKDELLKLVLRNN